MRKTFARPELAHKMAQTLLTNAIGSAVASGLFLAAPRRTGKSTFVREDLRPELEHLGALVVYADLWADRQADPGEVIVAAVRTAVAKHDGVVLRLAKAAGLDKVTVGGLAFSVDKVGLGAKVSLSAALAALSDEIKCPIVLIVDEAQHAITTQQGYDALFALKAARDELNSSAHYGLRIVATGSNQDKLAMLRNSKDQAFFGAPLIPFPPLDRAYIEWFCSHSGLNAILDPRKVETLFKQAGYRPEILGAAADQVRFDFTLTPAEVPKKFAAAVRIQIDASQLQTQQVIQALTPLQASVLRVMAARGDHYAPFEAETMTAYQTVLSAIAPNSKLKADAANVQQALAALQDKALVWKERRGMYALEDSHTKEVMEQADMLDIVPPRPTPTPRRARRSP